MKLHVEVTQEDINQGLPEDECCCPIALAIWREHGISVRIGAYEVFKAAPDGDDHLDIAPHYESIAELPPVAQAFILRFDDDGQVLPFAFDMDAPDDLLTVQA